MSICKSYNLLQLDDERGSLIALDKMSGLPFDIKRVYYVFNTMPSAVRGFHAHKKLHQVAVCVSGSCRMVLDDAINRESIIMNSSSLGIDLPPMLWHEMHDFSDDCILLVAASDYYDEQDYIRDYNQFMEAKVR